jgi:WD40 repeat protein
MSNNRNLAIECYFNEKRTVQTKNKNKTVGPKKQEKTRQRLQLSITSFSIFKDAKKANDSPYNDKSASKKRFSNDVFSNEDGTAACESLAKRMKHFDANIRNNDFIATSTHQKQSNRTTNGQSEPEIPPPTRVIWRPELYSSSLSNSSFSEQPHRENQSRLFHAAVFRDVELGVLSEEALYRLRFAHLEGFKVAHSFVKQNHSIFALSLDVTKTIIAGGGGRGMLSIFWLPDSISSFRHYEDSVKKNSSVRTANTLGEDDPFNLTLGSNDDEKSTAHAIQNRSSRNSCVGTISTPVCTFQAHTAWISGVHFTTFCSFKNALLTTADDGVINLWRVNKSWGRTVPNQSNPSPVASLATLRSIYSLDEWHSQLLTATKSASVGLYRLAEDRISPINEYTDYHTEVVKCARWRDGKLFASCGNDKLVNVYDIRAPKARVLCLPGMHTLSINTVAWEPNNEYRFLSSGFDSKINVYDLRKFESALYPSTPECVPLIAGQHYLNSVKVFIERTPISW